MDIFMYKPKINNFEIDLDDCLNNVVIKIF